MDQYKPNQLLFVHLEQRKLRWGDVLASATLGMKSAPGSTQGSLSISRQTALNNGKRAEAISRTTLDSFRPAQCIPS